MEKTVTVSKIVKLAVALCFLVFAIIVTSCAATKVDTGHVGIKVRFGKVVAGPLPADLYFVNPFTTDMKQVDTRVLSWNGKTEAYSKDVQKSVVFFTLNYNLDPAKAATVFQTVGEDWSQKLVGQVVHEEIEREMGQHNAVDVVGTRDTVAREIETNVKRILGARSVIVTSMQITNIDFTSEFEKSVEAKVIAQQKAIEEQNRTKQIEEQARQQIATAQGNAQATVLNAEAEAKSIKIRSEALANNPKLVEWEAVQKWNGVLPQYSMGGAVPFINLTTAR
jgi:regulator of protease activity HflC (stomatin/prohibitin superfamily)